MWTLHGVTWLHVEQTPTWDFLKSSRVNPTAWSIARPGARSGPSNTSDECGRLHAVYRRCTTGIAVTRCASMAWSQLCNLSVYLVTDGCRSFGHVAGRRLSVQDPLRSDESLPANKSIVNGQAAKAHRPVKEDDEIEIHRPFGRKQLITVLGVTDENLQGPGADAVRGPLAETDAGRGGHSPHGAHLSRRGHAADPARSRCATNPAPPQAGGVNFPRAIALHCVRPRRGRVLRSAGGASISWPTGCGSARWAIGRSTPRKFRCAP